MVAVLGGSRAEGLELGWGKGLEWPQLRSSFGAIEDWNKTNIDAYEGHGRQYLSSFMLTLNLLAFLFHTILQLVDQSYQLIRQRIVKRETFFEHLRALTRYMVFESWQTLIDFMINQSEPLPPRRARRRQNSS